MTTQRSRSAAESSSSQLPSETRPSSSLGFEAAGPARRHVRTGAGLSTAAVGQLKWGRRVLWEMEQV